MSQGDRRAEPATIARAPVRLVPPADVRFERLYRDRFQAVFAYVLRRARSTADVPDLVADVFTVAWRRIDQVPPPPEDLWWLYGVARRVVSGHGRSADRQGRLLARLRAAAPAAGSVEGAGGGGGAAGVEAPDDRVARAVARLRPTDRELLRLVAWERLSHAEAAAVLGCSPNAVAVRWHRLMRQLRRRLAQVQTVPPARAQVDRGPAVGPDDQAASAGVVVPLDQGAGGGPRRGCRRGTGGGRCR